MQQSELVKHTYFEFEYDDEYVPPHGEHIYRRTLFELGLTDVSPNSNEFDLIITGGGHVVVRVGNAEFCVQTQDVYHKLTRYLDEVYLGKKKIDTDDDHRSLVWVSPKYRVSKVKTITYEEKKWVNTIDKFEFTLLPLGEWDANVVCKIEFYLDRALYHLGVTDRRHHFFNATLIVADVDRVELKEGVVLFPKRRMFSGYTSTPAACKAAVHIALKWKDDYERKRNA